MRHALNCFTEILQICKRSCFFFLDWSWSYFQPGVPAWSTNWMCPLSDQCKTYHQFVIRVHIICLRASEVSAFKGNWFFLLTLDFVKRQIWNTWQTFWGNSEKSASGDINNNLRNVGWAMVQILFENKIMVMVLMS